MPTRRKIVDFILTDGHSGKMIFYEQTDKCRIAKYLFDRYHSGIKRLYISTVELG